MVPNRIINKRKVNEAMINMRWIADFQGALTFPVLIEYFELFQWLNRVELQFGVPDAHNWRLSTSGQFTTKSAYTAMFQGAIAFEPAERVWRTWSPSKCRFFIWLVEHDMYWMADKLARRGLDHLERCPLCDQQAETINHLLVSCVFARQVWDGLLQPVGLLELVPQPVDEVFDEWWRSSNMRVHGHIRKGFNSLMVLGAWVI
jgi:hypothetical protein